MGMIEKLGDNKLTYEVSMSVMFKSRARQVKRHYETSPDTASMGKRALLLGVISTDSLMTCYSRYLARLLSEHAPAFLSTFAWAPHSSAMGDDALCIKGPPLGASCHAGDIAYFLPNSARMTARTGLDYDLASGEPSLAEQYFTSFLSFAAARQHPFVGYSGAGDRSTVWNITGPSTTVGYHASHCDFLEDIGFPEQPWGNHTSAISPTFFV